MKPLVTYLEHPSKIPLYRNHHFDTIILDLPFCSIRSHQPYDWSNEEISHLKLSMSMDHLAFNLDGIYTDQELRIIHSTISTRQLDALFSICRIQDPGLILWLNHHFPSLDIHLNPETGMQNIPAIKTLHDYGIKRFILNHETPVSVIDNIAKELPFLKLEILVQGPILIQYSKRQFLSNLYGTSAGTSLRFDAEDKDLAQRMFTFLNTDFGHFMFAQFHRSLANYSEKLIPLDCYHLIDARGESDKYAATSFDLYTNLKSLTNGEILKKVYDLSHASKKPQKPGFFLANNTDYDWRDETKTKDSPVGHVISKIKGDETLIEFYVPLPIDSQLRCINPDQTEASIELSSRITNLDHQPIHIIEAFTPYLLVNHQKGIQFKGLLYLKNT